MWNSVAGEHTLVVANVDYNARKYDPEMITVFFCRDFFKGMFPNML